MESCLLCLEINKEFVETIKVNSILWQEENVKNIIEKHFWAMETILPSSWICKSCWQELYDFHKFYMRIEEAHLNLGNLTKTEYKIYETDQKRYFDNSEQNKTESLAKRHMESEILMELPISTEFLAEEQESFIKQEPEDDQCSSDDMPLEQRRKRGRPRNDLKIRIKKTKKDPLKKTTPCRKLKISTTKTKIRNEVTLNAITSSSSITEQSLEQSLIKDDPDTLHNSKVHDISFDFNNDETQITNEVTSNSITETHEQSLIKYDPDSFHNSKEFEFNNDDDSATDSDYRNSNKSRETKYKKQKNPDEQTRREHDKIIADNFQIFCSLCQIPMDNFIALRKHFRVEHKKRGFVLCCKRKIFSRPVLVDHIRFHLDPDYFKCKQCDKVLSERSTLERHMKTHEDGHQERKHACDLCGKSFKDNTSLEKHKLKHSADNGKKYSCTECDKFFNHLYNLNYHIQAIHRNKFVKICDMCGKTIRSSNSFKLHMQKHENKNGTAITCDICGLRLVDAIGLRRHKNSQHPVGGKKEYVCHICSKVFPNVKAVRTHIRSVHEIGYDHKCTICNKAFKRRAVLKDHMATHTGTALNTCPWCPKTFFSNGNMYNHRKKDHPREWEALQRQKYASNVAT